MPVLVPCPGCRRTLKIPDDIIGKRIRCPACQTSLVARPPAMAAADPQVMPASADSPPPRVATEADAGPGGVRRENAATGRRRPRRRDDDMPAALPAEDEDDWDDEDVRPRRTSRTGLWIGLAAGGGCLLVLLAGLVVLAVYVIHRMNTPPVAARKTVMVAPGRGLPVAGAQWQKFTVPGGDCTVEMPGEPTEFPSTKAGVVLKKWILPRPANGLQFVVAYFDLAPKALRPTLLRDISDAEAANLAKAVAGRVVARKDLTLGAYHGREIEIDSALEGRLIERIYLVNRGTVHRAYILTVAGPGVKAAAGDAARYFDSFKLSHSTSVPAAAEEWGGKPDPVRQRVYLADLEPAATKRGPWPLGRGDLGNPEHNPITVSGLKASKGLGLHVGDPYSSVTYKLDQKYQTFATQVGLNDTADPNIGGVEFEVLGDGKSLWKSRLIKHRGESDTCRLQVGTVTLLELRVNSRGYGGGAHTVWVNPFVERDGRKRPAGKG